MTDDNIIPFPKKIDRKNSGGPIDSTTDPKLVVWMIRHDPRFMNAEARWRATYNYVVNKEIVVDDGAFIFAEDESYLLTGITHRLHKIDLRDNGFAQHLWNKYGLIDRIDATKNIASAMKLYCRAKGKERTVSRFAYFCKATKALYISRYNGTCYKLDGKTCTVVPNGTGTTLFVDDDGGKTVGKTVDDVLVGGHNALFPLLIDSISYSDQAALSRDEQRLVLSTWMFCIAFPEIFPVKPLLLIQGDRGSGKTSAVQHMQIVLHGGNKTQTVSTKEDRDFPVKILRSPIGILDNVDTFIPWLQDRLCSYVTEAGWPRRKLFTNDTEYWIKPQSWIAISSINPSTFRRDDLADRSIIIRTTRREEFRRIALVRQELLTNRAKIFGEWLFYLNKIVGAVQQGALDKYSSSQYRLADFGAMLFLVGEMLGFDAKQVERTLRNLESERDILMAEGDILIDVLDRWLEVESNCGRALTAAQLFVELEAISTDIGQKFYKNPRKLSHTLTLGRTQKFFSVVVVGKRRNAKVYEIRRKAG